MKNEELHKTSNSIRESFAILEERVYHHGATDGDKFTAVRLTSESILLLAKVIQEQLNAKE